MKRFALSLVLAFVNLVLLLASDALLPVLKLPELLFIVLSLIIGTALIVKLYKNEKVFGFLTIYFILNLADFIILYSLLGSVITVLGIIVNLIGLFYSVYNYSVYPKHFETTPLEIYRIKDEVDAEATKRLEGRVISSESAKYYHAPACNYVKKIPVSKRITYSSAKEAEKSGKVQHNCNV